MSLRLNFKMPFLTPRREIRSSLSLSNQSPGGKRSERTEFRLKMFEDPKLD